MIDWGLRFPLRKVVPIREERPVGQVLNNWRRCRGVKLVRGREYSFERLR